MKHFNVAVLSILVLFFVSCGDGDTPLTSVSELFDEKPHKNIIVIDKDPNYGTKISNYNNRYVLLTLFDKKPNLENPNIVSMLTETIALGKVKNDRINLIIYTGFVDYWIDNGSYWVLGSVLSDDGTYIYDIFVSKEQVDFYSKNTTINNDDFMLPVALNLQLGNTIYELVQTLWK